MTENNKSICDDCIYINNGKGSEKCDSCELTGTNKVIDMTEAEARQDRPIKTLQKPRECRNKNCVAMCSPAWAEFWFDKPDCPNYVRGEDRPIGHWCVVCRDDDVYDIKGKHTWAINCYCSECSYKHKFIEGYIDYKICPNCAAKMQNVEES